MFYVKIITLVVNLSSFFLITDAVAQQLYCFYTILQLACKYWFCFSQRLQLFIWEPAGKRCRKEGIPVMIYCVKVY